MADLMLMECELAQELRSLAMLRPHATIPREQAMVLIERCLATVQEARHRADAAHTAGEPDPGPPAP